MNEDRKDAVVVVEPAMITLVMKEEKEESGEEVNADA